MSLLCRTVKEHGAIGRMSKGNELILKGFRGTSRTPGVPRNFEPRSVNGDRYRAIITNFFIPELNNHDVQELWFQQDGATCHTARATSDLLKDTFGDRLISRFGPVNWPPRSCDLTPLDYFLWGYVKSLVYADKPQTLDHLEDNIRRCLYIRPMLYRRYGIRPIYGHKCWKKSSKIGRPDWTTSEPAVAVLCQKSYLKCNATRLSFE
ncbi:putative DD41D transposase [Trichonephila clavipes]|nr:putative DD41D transposase [Trichonephila clavipes]